MFKHCALIVGIGFALGIGFAQDSTAVEIKNAAGDSVGTATLSAASDGAQLGVKIAVELHGLPPGDHAIHLHQNPKCEGPAFTTAGPHFNPDHKQHGLENPSGPHAGDMKNITISSDGAAKVTVVAADANYTSEKNSIFANGGTAIVIHAKADDMRSDPSGNAGDRIACGVIKK